MKFPASKCLLAIRLLIFMLLTNVSMGQQSIEFSSKSFNSACKEAKKQNKIIFIDAYTTWCGPCKWMDKNVFSDAKVAKFYNATFVNLKVNMENKGGRKLSNVYKITSYPSFLFVNSEGKLLHRARGARGAEDFINLGLEAVDPENRIDFYEANFSSKKENPKFLYKYAELLNRTADPLANDMALKYLATQKDWKSEKNLRFIYDFASYNLNGELLRYMLNNALHFEEIIGKDKLESRLIKTVLMNVRPEGNLNDLELLMDQYCENSSDKFRDKIRIDFMFESYLPSEKESFYKLVREFYYSYGFDNWQRANNTAWKIFEDFNDPVKLNVGLEIANSSVELRESYYNLDTAAALHLKLGQIEQAQSKAERAIFIGNKAGIDFSSSALLLKYIRDLKKVKIEGSN